MPYISAPPIPASGTQNYDFRLDFPGTFWMHSHVGFQEQQLLSAPLIIHDAGTRSAAVQEIVVMLHDFTFRDPREVFASSLKQGGRKQTVSAPPAMSGMQNMKPDLNDVDYDAFLANDRTLADPSVIRVEPGGHVRLRLINGSAATNYWIDLGGLRGTLIAVDGTPVRPVVLQSLPLAIAQRADILIELPRERGAYAHPRPGGGQDRPDRHRAGNCTGERYADRGACDAAISGPRLHLRACVARSKAACVASGRDRAGHSALGRYAGLCLDDGHPGLSQNHAGHGFSWQARGTCHAEQDHDVASDASAWSPFSGDRV